MKIAGCGSACLALAAWNSIQCDRWERREESLLSEPVEDAQLQPTRAAGLPSEAVRALAQARCAREQACNNIGPGKAYVSQPDCQSRVRVDWEEDLNTLRCPRGINDAALAECLREIRETDCSGLVDTLGRWAHCAASEMCDRPTRIEISPP